MSYFDRIQVQAMHKLDHYDKDSRTLRFKLDECRIDTFMTNTHKLLCTNFTVKASEYAGVRLYQCEADETCTTFIDIIPVNSPKLPALTVRYHEIVPFMHGVQND